jgi:hypothetical protein
MFYGKIMPVHCEDQRKHTKNGGKKNEFFFFLNVDVSAARTHHASSTTAGQWNLRVWPGIYTLNVTMDCEAFIAIHFFRD